MQADNYAGKGTCMDTNSSFSVRFWGVRGSYPAPGPSTVRYGGNTPCVEVRVNGYTIILDAGTGIIPLGRDLMRRAKDTQTPVEAVLLFSHLHHDHTQGLPFFAPAFATTSRLHLLGPDFMNSSPKVALDTIMTPPHFPVHLSDLNAWISFATLREPDLLLIGESVGGIASGSVSDEAAHNDPDLIKVRVMRSYAHPNGVLHYRIEWHGQAVVYATDTEGYVNGDQRLAKFSHGANLLIHDAQYTDEHYLGKMPGMPTTQGFGHSTPSIAIGTARLAGVEKLVLFHHAPEYSDEILDRTRREISEQFPEAMVAYESLQINLAPTQTYHQPSYQPQSFPAKVLST
jgi:phosphoribosyl 1,2-cyclic phosphodiesterase